MQYWVNKRLLIWPNKLLWHHFQPSLHENAPIIRYRELFYCVLKPIPRRNELKRPERNLKPIFCKLLPVADVVVGSRKA